jgi:hypothetical protein
MTRRQFIAGIVVLASTNIDRAEGYTDLQI